MDLTLDFRKVRISGTLSFDFRPDCLYFIGQEIVERGTEDEANLFGCLFARIMPPEEIQTAIDMLLEVLQVNPGHTIAQTMLHSLQDASYCS